MQISTVVQDARSICKAGLNHPLEQKLFKQAETTDVCQKIKEKGK
jgi:hypothetical protein